MPAAPTLKTSHSSAALFPYGSDHQMVISFAQHTNNKQQNSGVILTAIEMKEFERHAMGNEALVEDAQFLGGVMCF